MNDDFDKLFELLFKSCGPILYAKDLATIFRCTPRSIYRSDQEPCSQRRKFPVLRNDGRGKYCLLSDLIAWWRERDDPPANLAS